MIGITNHDASFFELTSTDVSVEAFDPRRIQSLTITEQRDAMPQGSISFYDPENIASRVLRTGANIFVNWGYRQALLQTEIVVDQFNVDEINGSLVRRGMQGFVSSPSGQGGQNGVITYNCNFTGYGFRGLDETRRYTSGTKFDVISAVFDRLGVSTTRRAINFRAAADVLSEERYVRQDETDFAFLSRLAREYRALFAVGFAPDGETVAVFIDTDQVGDASMPGWIADARGTSHIIGYKGEVNNVISYRWISNESESGVGANTQIEFVNGEVVVRRFVAESETIVSYRLNPARIEAVLSEAQESGITSLVNVTRDLLSANDFEQIQHFFDPYESTTAPQGFGYRITAEMIGNPLFMPPNQIVINNGFPDRLGGRDTRYYIDKVTHKLDQSGYKMTVEIIDAFGLSDIGVGIL